MSLEESTYNAISSKIHTLCKYLLGVDVKTQCYNARLSLYILLKLLFMYFILLIDVWESTTCIYTNVIFQVDYANEDKNEKLDPLRVPCSSIIVPFEDLEDASNGSNSDISGSCSVERLEKDWNIFKRFLVQKFPPSKTVAISSVCVTFFQLIYVQ